MLSRPRLFASLALVLGLVTLPAGPSLAGPEVLKRAVSNILCAPVDLALSPAVAGITMVDNLKNVGDSDAVRYFYPPFGFLWLTGVQAGGAALRGIAGALEILPGLALLPFDATLQPLFGPADKGNALVDKDTPVLHFKIGVDYTSPPS